MDDSNRIGPQPGPQTQFLASPADIAIYGGAAGGGKTWALLMEPLRHVANPQFGAVFFRRTTVQVRNEGGLWDESAKLYPLLGAEPREHVLDYRFPSGAAVSFAHLEYDKTVLNWQGSQIPLICLDELTHFSQKQFWYLLGRNRSTCGVRPYIRATCNPDADSWVADLISWWIDPATGLPIPERAGVLRWFVRVNETLIWADRREDLAQYRDPSGEPIPPKSLTFVPAKLTDNTALTEANPDYLGNLMALGTVERERLLHGNWKIKNTESLVFTNWRIAEFDTPDDAVLRFGADWGFATDPTVLVRCFIRGRQLFVDYEAAEVGCEIDETPALFAGDCPNAKDNRDGLPHWENPRGAAGVPGAYKWPIRADSARPETVSYMKRKGFRVKPAIKGPGSIEDGVKFLQSFEIVVHTRCPTVAGELKRHSYKTDDKTGDILPIMEDRDNNTIDALRYALEEVRRAPERETPPEEAVKRDGYWPRDESEGDNWKTA
jgi:hypothetical protein